MVGRDRSDGFLVVGRFNWFDQPCAANPDARRMPVSGFSHEYVFQRYRGIEGDPWPEATGLNQVKQVDLDDYGLGLGGIAPVDQLEKVIEYYRAVSRQRTCDLLFLDFVWRCGQGIRPPSSFSFQGYDYGTYSSGAPGYSCLFHEVIYALDEELIALSKQLDPRSLLLPTLESVERLVEVRQSLIARGIPLEMESTFWPFEAVGVYALPRATSDA